MSTKTFLDIKDRAGQKKSIPVSEINYLEEDGKESKFGTRIILKSGAILFDARKLDEFNKALNGNENE